MGQANEVYDGAGQQFSVSNRDVLTNALYPFQRWSTLKSNPPFVGGHGGFLYDSVGNADMLSTHLIASFQGSSR